jgi:hypothetical protein
LFDLFAEGVNYGVLRNQFAVIDNTKVPARLKFISLNAKIRIADIPQH